VREFYSQKIAQCLLASQQVHTLSDKKAVLRMAARYVGLVLESDLGEDRRYDTTPAIATGIADRPCSWDLLDAARADSRPASSEAAPDRRRTFRVFAGGRVE
jgi:hypothetical protein